MPDLLFQDAFHHPPFSTTQKPLWRTSNRRDHPDPDKSSRDAPSRGAVFVYLAQTGLQVEGYAEGRSQTAVQAQAGPQADRQSLVQQLQGQHPPAALRYRQRAGEVHHLADRGWQRGRRVTRCSWVEALGLRGGERSLFNRECFSRWVFKMMQLEQSWRL